MEVAARQWAPLEKRFGVPLLAEGPRAGDRSRFVMLALGKLGGRELNYHSDLDLMLVYEGDGRTGPPPGATRFDRFEPTDNFHFFTELAQRIIRAASYLGPMGRLYQIDMRLRPTGKSGSLVLPLAEFRRYFAAAADGEAHPHAGAQLWERQALTRARVVHGDADFGGEVMAAVAEAVGALDWRPELADEIADMRERLEASRGPRDLKRGGGGVVDVEFLVQTVPAEIRPGTAGVAPAEHLGGAGGVAGRRPAERGGVRRPARRLRLPASRPGEIADRP